MSFPNSFQRDGIKHVSVPNSTAMKVKKFFVDFCETCLVSEHDPVMHESFSSGPAASFDNCLKFLHGILLLGTVIDLG